MLLQPANVAFPQNTSTAHRNQMLNGVSHATSPGEQKKNTGLIVALEASADLHTSD